jgi:hypothetical protein
MDKPQTAESSMKHHTSIRISTLLLLLLAAFAVAPRTQAQSAKAMSDQFTVDAATGCAAYNPSPTAGESITWKGPCAAGHLTGTGTLTWIVNGKTMNTRTGDWKDGRPDKSGEVKMADGSTIIGNWVAGMLEGFTRVVYADGTPMYEGQYHQDVWNGEGTFHNQLDGSVYSGSWLAGDYSGKGVLTLANGDKFDGDWVKGAGNGRVIETFVDGSHYEGQWADDMRTEGTLRRADGTSYTGTFCKNLPCNTAPAPRARQLKRSALPIINT